MSIGGSATTVTIKAAIAVLLVLALASISAPASATPKRGTVPTVVGLRADDAVAKLKRAGFTKTKFDRRVVVGKYWRVQSQSPGGGKSVATSTTVRLVVVRKVAASKAPAHTLLNARARVEAGGNQWPFTVADGTVRCENGLWVTFAAEGHRYAVNGTARTQSDYPDIDPIWAPGTIEGTKVNIGPIIDIGLDLC
jgi:hypothetical protein